MGYNMVVRSGGRYKLRRGRYKFRHIVDMLRLLFNLGITVDIYFFYKPSIPSELMKFVEDAEPKTNLEDLRDSGGPTKVTD